jgi:hypothetical protein
VCDVIVGAGGTGVANGTGNTGGASYVTYNATTFISAVGGGGGTKTTAGTGGQISSNIPVNTGFKGGNGSAGTVGSASTNNNSGGGGGGAGSSAAGSNASASNTSVAGTGGAAGATGGLKGADGISTSGNTGGAGITPVATYTPNVGLNVGGGGSGGTVWSSGTQPGGAGAKGAVVISYTINPLVTVQTISASGAGVFTVPINVCYVYVECWGGGGGGGYVKSNIGASGGGGGGGAYTYGGYVDVTAVTTVNYTVGAGGTGGIASSTTQGLSGGTTTFNSSTPVVANGGGFGTGTTSGTTGGAGGVGGTGGTYNGGSGAAGVANSYGGGGGGSGGVALIGNSSSSRTAAPQVTYGGAGGDGGQYTGTGTLGAGTAGSAPGGGGGGACKYSSLSATDYNGGTGGNGQIVISYALCQNDIVLPVELLSFSAKCLDAKKLFNWQTAIETNNAYFTLEKSKNGETFETVEKIKGNGNSTRQLNYNYSYEEENASYKYYRLSQTDFNGKTKILKLTYLSCIDALGNLKLYPNPANSEIKLEFEASKEAVFTINITDIMGRLLKSTQYLANQGLNQALVEIQDLPPGSYHVTIASNTGSRPQILKFIKSIN